MWWAFEYTQIESLPNKEKKTKRERKITRIVHSCLLFNWETWQVFTLSFRQIKAIFVLPSLFISTPISKINPWFNWCRSAFCCVLYCMCTGEYTRSTCLYECFQKSSMGLCNCIGVGAVQDPDTVKICDGYEILGCALAGSVLNYSARFVSREGKSNFRTVWITSMFLLCSIVILHLTRGCTALPLGQLWKWLHTVF